MPRAKTIYVDLDATLNEYGTWKGGHHFPPLRPGALGFLDNLLAQGFRLKLYTARAVNWKLQVEAWLVREGLDRYFVAVTAEKGMDAWLFVDDRGIQFQGDYAEVLAKIDAWKHVEPTGA